MNDTSYSQFLRATVKLYPACGYQKLSVRALAAEAGLSSGMFHHLFASKEDFMVHVFEDYFQAAFGWFDETFAAELDALPRLGQTVYRLALSLRQHEAWIIRMLMDCADSVDVVRGCMRKQMDKHLRLLDSLFAQVEPQWDEAKRLRKISYLQSTVMLPMLAANMFAGMGIFPDSISRTFLQQRADDEAVWQRVQWSIQTIFPEKEAI